MRRVLVAGGVLVMAYALIGAVVSPDVDRAGVLIFLAAVLVLHDAVFLPLVLAAGALIDRVVPPGWRATARAVGLVGLAAGVVALPLAIGPLDGPYLRGLLVILVVSAVCRKGIERWRNARRGRVPG
ncbi:hypothetical protein ACQP2X_15515 [Actinoplanes sp. CA-131856]